MESKSHNRVPDTSFIDTGSIHQLQGIKWLRILAFLVIVVGLDFSGINSDADFPHKTQHWLSEFIAVNDLTLPKSITKDHPDVLRKEDGKLLAVASISNLKKTSTEKKANKEEFKKRDKPASPVENIRPNKFPVWSINPQSLIKLEEKQHSNTVFVSFMETENNQIDLFSSNDLVFDYEPSALVDDNLLVKKWHVFVGIGPQFVNGDVTQPSADKYEKVSGINDIVSEAGGITYSSNEPSFAAHVGLGYDLSKHWSVKMAIQYAQFNGSQIAYYDSEVTRTQTILTTKAVSDENGTKGFETEEETIEYTNHFSDTLYTNYRLTNLEVPIAIQYQQQWGKYYGFLRTGVSGVFNSNYSASYDSKEIGSGVITQESWKLTAMNMNLSLGMGYKINPDFGVQIYPQYSKLIPVQGSSSIQHVTRSLGVFGGVVYSFK